MKQRPRIYYTEEQKAMMWDRWQKGETLGSIARLFDRHHPSIERILAETGGIRPAPYFMRVSFRNRGNPAYPIIFLY